MKIAIFQLILILLAAPAWPQAVAQPDGGSGIIEITPVTADNIAPNTLERMIESALKRKDYSSMLFVGSLLLESKDVKNQARGIELVERAVEEGGIQEGRLSLHRVYRDGLGGKEKNVEKAFQYLKGYATYQDFVDVLREKFEETKKEHPEIPEETLLVIEKQLMELLPQLCSLHGDDYMRFAASRGLSLEAMAKKIDDKAVLSPEEEKILAEAYRWYLLADKSQTEPGSVDNPKFPSLSSVRVDLLLGEDLKLEIEKEVEEELKAVSG